MNIDRFEGEYFFLSNFFESPITYKNFTYQTVEAAFQAQKEPGTEEKFAAMKPGKAKREGLKVNLRSDWEAVKVQIMKDLLVLKFQNEALKQKLLLTELKEIVEGNNWGDCYWGVCEGKGQNVLGKLLMEVRQELK
ncbi:NADAR_family protein [Hexamita inflata]|uniref:NADAR family protein n=1 Tax=Hexamita inflata TaxID=28002 RepID=A0AA86URY9_9EUKA|nr:NADAR family protein [Hexamita inflata]CAI9965769.1 NADAR family protein [Hexamita inflata]